jgi:hypothetical protein
MVHLLKQLHSYGIIQYQPLSDTPQLFLLKNRMYSDDFKIDHKQILLRREYYEQRVKAIIRLFTGSRQMQGDYAC